MTPSIPGRRDRLLVLSCAFGVSALAWLIMVDLGTGTAMMPSSLPLLFGLWLVMMVAMMTPSVAPTLLMYASILRSQAQRPFFAVAVFLLGYLSIWSLFAGAAALLQFEMQSLFADAAVLTGVMLAAAGIFQLTPLKNACLAKCRSPQGFFITSWREGATGAYVMGGRHGVYCLGCCWLLMGILLAAGAMNLLVMAVLAVYVLAEKIAPAGKWLSRVAGLLLVGAGACVVLGIF